MLKRHCNPLLTIFYRVIFFFQEEVGTSVLIYEISKMEFLCVLLL